MKKQVYSLDMRFAAAALRYGRRHEGLTNPNPCVSALVVVTVNGRARIVGRGVTGKGGRPHAEVLALQQAGSKAKGATLYVTLEPCSHHGLTPPCTDAILASGVARVVACTADPDPRVSGTGFARLRAEGVELSTPVLDAEARRFHAGHIAAKTRHRPHVILKMAVSTNGMIGRKSGGQVAITGPEAWTYVHGLRAVNDAILVGVGTIIGDDPSLTCRLPGLDGRSPQRVVLDSGNQIPENAKVLTDKNGPDTQIFDQQSCESILKALCDQGVKTVMIEGGARVASAFLRAGLVDACHVLQSGTMVIEDDGVPAPLDLMMDAATFEQIDQRQLGDDQLKLFWRRD